MRKKTEELVNYANTILQKVGKPLHAGEIYAVLVDAELFDGTRQALYNTLYNQIRDADTEEEILFHFLGKGFFATRSLPLSSEYTIVQPKPRPPHGINYNRKGDIPGDKEKRIKYVEDATANPTCGNCAFITFKHVQTHLKEVGGCAKYSQTKRACVYPTSPSCDLWKIGSLNKAKEIKRKVVI